MIFWSVGVAVQLRDAMKIVVTPWNWVHSQYVAVQGQYDDDGVYLDPDDEAEKTRLLRYEWCGAWTSTIRHSERTLW